MRTILPYRMNFRNSESSIVKHFKPCLLLSLCYVTNGIQRKRTRPGQICKGWFVAIGHTKRQFFPALTCSTLYAYNPRGQARLSPFFVARFHPRVGDPGCPVFLPVVF